MRAHSLSPFQLDDGVGFRLTLGWSRPYVTMDHMGLNVGSSWQGWRSMGWCFGRAVAMFWPKIVAVVDLAVGCY